MVIRYFKCFIFSLTILVAAGNTESHGRDLIANIAIIHPHSIIGKDGQSEGAFVDLVKAMGRNYKNGRITTQLFPMARSVMMVKTGQADFHIPAIIHPHISVSDYPFAFSSEPIVKVAFVLYSRSDRPELQMHHLKKYRIETMRGIDIFPFAVLETDSFEQGIRKMMIGRTDGFIVEQEAADKYIRGQKIKNIRRTLYAEFYSRILIAKGPEGKKIDSIVSGLLRRLKEDGTLEAITAAIHKPFDDWQPYQMDWQ